MRARNETRCCAPGHGLVKADLFRARPDLR